jgi:hypothetical protein
MKSFRQFIQESPVPLGSQDSSPLTQMPPTMVVMNRESVRQYPHTKIALYYAKSIDRYFTIIYQ